ncbi:MAG: peptidoglycan-binding protein [Myxococcales bacterium]|nr:peptidoglycan-binding protein [Myxococcales bacterium]
MVAISKEFPNYSQLTFETEGGRLPLVLRPHCPGEKSGVTIGPGYDMKERKSAQVEADLKAAGIPDDLAKKLSDGVKKSGDGAKEWIAANFPGKGAVITVAASSNLFLHVYPSYAKMVREKVSELWQAPWDQLPTNMKEVLVDLAYRGDLQRDKSQKPTKHEKLIKPSVVANDFVAFRKLMTDYQYWQDNTNLKRAKNGTVNQRITARGKWLEGGATGGSGGVHFPVDLGKGTAAGPDNADAFYEHNEVEFKGGYFPIGANTVWHGGVHLHVKRGTPVRAMWDGKLVAARLPDDVGKAGGHFGSRCFVLVSHEASGATLNKLTLKGKLTGYKIRIGAVNLRAKASTSGDKLATLGKGDELTRVGGKDTKADGYTWAQVKVAKAKDPAAAGLQGYVAIRAEWYYAVREEKTVEKLDEAKTYTFYSLYMHLDHERLDGSSRALDEVRWLHAAPATSSDALGGDVGEPPSANAKADVQKVQERLTVHGAYSGASTGSYDAATKAAIGKFQDKMVSDKVIGKTDHVISAKGKTWKALQRAPKREHPELDATIVEKLRGGGVVALDKPVRGGDVLWTSGCYGSASYRAELIHWEVFSAEPIAPGWTEVDDDDDDFNLDNAAIVGMVQQDDGWWENDEILTIDEIVRFYRKHKQARALRHYACKFISEWAIDLDVAIPKMKGANVISTYGLKERMQPYLWWKEASDQKVALPSSAKCWHYNPIALASALAGVVPGARAPPRMAPLRHQTGNSAAHSG